MHCVCVCENMNIKGNTREVIRFITISSTSSSYKLSMLNKYTHAPHLSISSSFTNSIMEKSTPLQHVTKNAKKRGDG